MKLIFIFILKFILNDMLSRLKREMGDKRGGMRKRKVGVEKEEKHMP